MTWMRIIAALLLVAAVLAACASDIVLPDVPSLKGRYSGLYSLTLVEGTQSEVHEQNVHWVFTDTSWNMNTDSSDYFDECFCRHFGSYTLEDRLRLLERSTKNIPDIGCDTVGGQELCALEWGPDGTFDVKRPGDTLILTRSASGGGTEPDTVKIIRLVRRTN